MSKNNPQTANTFRPTALSLSSEVECTNAPTSRLEAPADRFVQRALDHSSADASPAVEPVVIGLGLNEEEVRVLSGCTASRVPLRLVSDAQSLFQFIEQAVAPVALVAMNSPGLDLIQIATILRRRHMSMPIFVICETQIEASYFSMRQDLGPTTGVVGSFEGGGELLMGMVLDVHRCKQTQCGSRENVSERELARVFVELRLARATGVLHITRGAIERSVYFLDGEPINADSNLLDENFGRFLLSRGLINWVEYRWSQQIQQREGVRQGEALCKIGVLDQTRLQSLLTEQIFEKIQNSFGVGVCTYEFKEEGGWLWRDSVYHFDLLELLAKGMWRTTPVHKQRERWDALAGHFLVIQPPGVNVLKLPTQYFDFEQGSSIGVLKVHDVFSPDTPLRERLAVLDALLLSHSARLCSAPPAGLQVLDLDVSVYGGHTIDMGGLEVLETACLGEATSPRELLQVSEVPSPDELEFAYSRLKRCFSAERFQERDEIAQRIKRINARLEFAYRTLSVSPAADEEAHEAVVAHERREAAERRQQFIEAEIAYHDGTELIRDEQFELAIERFCRAQELNPNEPLFILYEGWARVCCDEVGSDQWEEGTCLLRSALEISPNMAAGYLFLARCDLMRNDVKEAAERLRIVLQLEPSNQEARAMLSGLMIQSTDPDALHC